MSSEWVDKDREYIWHPYTQHGLGLDPLPVVSAQGAYLELADGSRVLDAISSWWVNVLGHSHPEIAHAIAEQAKTLEHVIFAGFTHQPAVELAETLLSACRERGASFSRVFYSDNGSTAVEVALKMAFQFHHNNQDTTRTRFLALKGSYHGDTFGAMSVGDPQGLHPLFRPLLASVDFVTPGDLSELKQYIERSNSHQHDSHQHDSHQHDSHQHDSHQHDSHQHDSHQHDSHQHDSHQHDSHQHNAHQADVHLSNTPPSNTPGGRYAAWIVEPLIQGAGGMNIYSSEYLREGIRLCRAAGIPVIFDEVFTGFYRTGTAFAFEQVGEMPDFLCLSKGITGGFLPLAVTLTTDRIFQAFRSNKLSQAFLHGHSYTANPIACAAAIATWQLLQSNETQDRIRQITRTTQARLATIKNLPGVSEVRSLGTIGAIQLKGQSTYFSEVASKIRAAAIKKGVLLRPLGNVVYTAPPYCLTDAELERMFDVVGELIQELHGTHDECTQLENSPYSPQEFVISDV